ncbi:MAG: hypothetical protein ACI3YC_00910 [Alloprevotella sp.]
MKRNPERYNESLLQAKVESIQGELSRYETVKLLGLSMNDM